MNRKTVVDPIRADELFLCTINDSKLQPQIHRVIIALRKHYERGDYSIEKAVTLWEKIATYEARIYVHRFCEKFVKYYYVFNNATRKDTAKQMEEYYREQVMEG